MRFEVSERIAGTTLIPTWINSGQTPSSITSKLLTGSATVVNTATPVSSGDGHYFALHALPSSPSDAWYINEWVAVISASTYVNRQFIHAMTPEVL